MIWEALERVKTLKFKVNGWEALGDIKGDTATYRAEFGESITRTRAAITT